MSYPVFIVVPADGIRFQRPETNWCIVVEDDEERSSNLGFVDRDRAEAYVHVFNHPTDGPSSSCDICGRPAMHEMRWHGRDFRFCCEHHVEQGGSPANWHDECLSSWNRLFPTRRYYLRIDGDVVGINRDKLEDVIHELTIAKDAPGGA